MTPAPAVRRLLPVLALALAPIACPPVLAQPAREPPAVLLDLSTEALIDGPTARGLLEAEIPARVWRAYPKRKWAVLSQVEGGLSPQGLCIVTARVLLLPRVGTHRAVLWRPEKRAAAFEARPGATAETCRETARQKLKEAIAGLVSLVKG